MVSVVFKQEAQSEEGSPGKWPAVVGPVPGVSEVLWELTEPKPTSSSFCCDCELVLKHF